MSARPIAFGLVGAGRVALSYAEAFAGWSGGRIVAVADVCRDRAEALADRLGACAHRSASGLAESAEVEAAIVCTPPATHRPVTEALLGGGLHVLCEKPLSVGSADARAMVSCAERAGRILAMASKFRHVADVGRARDLVAGGAIGRPVLVENAFMARVDMDGRWNAVAAVSGGGVLADNGPHSVDLLRQFLGPLELTHVAEGPRLQGLSVEETVRMLVRSRDGITGIVDLSWSADPRLEHYLRIRGTEGALTLGWRRSAYRPTGASEEIVFGRGYDRGQAFRAQIESFARAVRGEGPVVPPVEAALASVELIEAAYAALGPAAPVPAGRCERARVPPVSSPEAASDSRR